MWLCWEAKAWIPHIFQPVNRQEIGGHGEVQLVDEGGHFGSRVQQVDDGATELAQFSLGGKKRSRAHTGTQRGRRPSPKGHGEHVVTRTTKGSGPCSR